MKYISVCSGIEAATVAWHPLGWEALAFSEIEKFPSAVLKYHWPDIPNHDDFTTIRGDEYGRPDILVGGTPCQSFSIAGLRGGLDDERGNLALEYLKLAERTRAQWLVWENVPGVLSSTSHEAPDPCPPKNPVDMGCEGQEVETEDEYSSEEVHAFNCFLAGLSELGYGFAFRVLDAQFYGVAQRRRRVFVVGYLGDWRPPAAVLFEQDSLSWNPAPSREKGKETTGNVAIGIDEECNAGIEKFGTLVRSGQGGTKQAVATVGSLTSKPNDDRGDGGGKLICMAHGQGGAEIREDGSPSLTCNHEAPILFTTNDGGRDASDDISPTMRSGGDGGTPTLAVAISGRARGDDGRGYDRPEHISKEVAGSIDTIKPEAVAYSIMPMNSGKDYKARETDISQPIIAAGPGANQGGDCICYEHHMQDSRVKECGETSPQINAKAGTGGGNLPLIQSPTMVRRLTPIECERLQGFPDNYTQIPWRNKEAVNCPDGPRYKALGNSFAVPVISWIGKRIELANKLI